MSLQRFLGLLIAIAVSVAAACAPAGAQTKVEAGPGGAVKRGREFALTFTAAPTTESVTVRLCPTAVACPPATGITPPGLITGRRDGATRWSFLLPERQAIGTYAIHLVAGPGKEEFVGTLRVMAAGRPATSPHSAALFAILASVAAVVAGVLLVAWLMGLKLGRIAGTAPRMQNGGELGPLKALLVDRGSSSYSLTALQFLVWTFTAIGVYAYVWMLRLLVWGDASLPEVANGLVQVLGIGTGTGVLSATLNAFGSGKGNGDFHPSRSDFITSGGNLAPERLQQFLWLWIGALGYVVTTFGANPAELVAAPELPESILTLSGLSAAGFLAGKLGRGPGPVIAGVVVVGKVAPTPLPKAEGATAGDPPPTDESTSGSIKLALSGANLSPAATFLLAAAQPSTLATGTRSFAPAVQLLAKLDPASPPVMPAGGTFATQLTVTLAGQGKFSFADASWFSLTIVNPDGERSNWEFQC